jgi:two-component system, NarL family, response regulator DevR
VPADIARETRVYIVDDHDLVRRGVRDLLAAARDIVVVGESNSAAAAPKSILTSGVDVMLLDLHLPDGSGIGVCRRVRAVDPSIKGLLLTAADDDEAAVAAIVAGAAGYAIKAASNVDLVGVVRAVGAGANLIDASVRHRVEQFLLDSGTLRIALSDDDQRVLALVGDGRTDRDIAEEIGADIDVVSRRVSELVFKKTGLAPTDPGDEPGAPGRHRRGRANEAN